MTAVAPERRTAARPPAAVGIELGDLADLRRDIVDALEELDDLLLVAGDATSPAPVWTPEGAAGDVGRHGATIRMLLQLCASRVDGIAALVRLAGDLRRSTPISPERQSEPRRGAARGDR